jgi:predicted SPOUT superfamily RNA methylase MTH1
VDEIIVYDDGQSSLKPRHHARTGYGNEDVSAALTDPDGFLIHLLSYLECPPYLRKRLFSIHPDLRGAGVLPPLDIPSHLKPNEWCQYREGVSVGPVGKQSATKETPRKKQKKDSSAVDGSEELSSTLVDAGFPVEIAANIAPNTRITLKFSDTYAPSDFPFSKSSADIGLGTEAVITAEAQDPALPREEAGYYWGYNVRRASTLSSIFTECPFEDGYDISLGTSERGQSIFELLSSSRESPLPAAVNHALIVFGGLGGLEVAAAADEDLANKGIDKRNVSELFDHYVDICPGQGSRTIRTEEAVLIALAQLRQWTSTAIQ